MKARVYKRHGDWFSDVPELGVPRRYVSYEQAQYWANNNVKFVREHQVKDRIQSVKELVDGLMNPQAVTIGADWDAYLKGYSERLAEDGPVSYMWHGPAQPLSVALGDMGGLATHLIELGRTLPGASVDKAPGTWLQWWKREMDATGSVSMGSGADVVCVSATALMGGLTDWLRGWGRALKACYRG